MLIRRRGTVIPFNIQGLQVIEYDQDKFASIDRPKAASAKSSAMA